MLGTIFALLIFVILPLVVFWLCVAGLARRAGASKDQASVLASLLTIFLIDD